MFKTPEAIKTKSRKNQKFSLHRKVRNSMQYFFTAHIFPISSQIWTKNLPYNNNNARYASQFAQNSVRIVPLGEM